MSKRLLERRRVQGTVKRAVIAGFVALIAFGGALSAFAADRAVETSVTLEMEFGVDLSSRAAFVNTRQEGEEWVRHDFPVPLQESPGTPTLLVSEPVELTVPVSYVVGAGGAAPTPLSAPRPSIPVGEAPSGRATCCTVRGMWDDGAAQQAITAEVRSVIEYARTNLGLTHEGPITINISHSLSGLKVRYKEAFGEALDVLPSECSFQRGEHLFFGPACRGKAEVIAREWFIRATRAHHVSARWAGVATVDYYWTRYQLGEPPSLQDPRYLSAVFWEPATDFRAGRGSDALMAAAALYAVESYGTFEDWLGFYSALLSGAEVHSAFKAALGVDLLRFYSDFEAWATQQKTFMLALAYRSCSEAARHTTARRLDEGGGFPHYKVPLEVDDDGDGYVCEGYASFDREEELTCLVLGEVSTEEEE